MIRDLITPGLGFTPGSVKYIITRGLDIGAVVSIPTFQGRVSLAMLSAKSRVQAAELIGNARISQGELTS